MTKILNLSLIPILFLHIWLATSFELSHDEAYYWLYSQRLDWGFFDHPPMVALIIKSFSFLSPSEFSVRLGFILLQLCTSLMLMQLVPKPRQWLALLLFFAFPLASFSGLFALPDLPLLFMTTLYCVLLKRYLEKSDALSVVGLGLVISLLFYSKYHGVLVIFFTLIAVPRLLKRKDFYVIALIALLSFLPHMLWQYEHDFSTLRYHFFERPKVDFSFKRILEYSVTQIFLAGLFVGPLVWWTTLKLKTHNDFHRAMKFVCIGTFIFFFVSTFSKKFEANWTIFLTAPLIILGAQSLSWEKKWVKILLVCSVLPVFLARFLLAFEPEVVKIKRLSEFHGWKKWAQTVDQNCSEPILANTYQMASKLSFYLQQPIHALNMGSRKNQFDYWRPDHAYYLSPMVCYVTDKKGFEGEILPTPEGKNLKLVESFIPAQMQDNNP
ncbi:MAG: glycosyltransferase family 39 protein [Bdellovibrionales bacterium]|nr:glycosyltransferase family 39 protein [Bdellovibrionales bacterium]